MTVLDGVRFVAATIAVISFIYSLRLVKAGWNARFPEYFTFRNILKNPKTLQVLVWTGWTLLPPVWFLLEYAVFNCTQPVAYKEAIERFKYNQDLASKIWIAVASALLVLYFGKDIKRG